jgi:hypothetical protein
MYCAIIVEVLWIDISLLFFLYNDWSIIAQFQFTFPFSNNPQSDNMDSKQPARPFPSSNFNSSSSAASTDTVPTSNLSELQHPSAYLLCSQSQQIPLMSQAAAARGILPPLPPLVVDPLARLIELRREMDMIVQMIGGGGPPLPTGPAPHPVTVNVPKHQSPPNYSGDDSGNSVSDQMQHSLSSTSNWSHFMRNNPINQDILNVILQHRASPAPVDNPPSDPQSESDDEEDDA